MVWELIFLKMDLVYLVCIKHPEAKGIGLFLTKAQVEAMGGEISVASKVNEGTTFKIAFNLNHEAIKV